MDSVKRKGIQTVNMYQEWVCANPQLTSEIESSVKWISYFLAGKVSDSTVLSELVYSISNLWVLLNDRILLNAQNKITNDNKISLKTWLTVLEYSEVFIEITARQVWGTKAKWIVIAMIQTFKCALRLRLLFKYRENILQCPPISPLDRKKIGNDTLSNGIEPHRNNTSIHTINSTALHGSTPNEGFTLKSGRTIRSVTSATISARSWRPPSSQSLRKTNVESDEHRLTDSQRVGEALYIVKPLVHLGSMYLCGKKAWAPWVFSLLMDASSLTLLNSTNDSDGKNRLILWSKCQQFELHRRKMLLLLYLLRSPFYDHYTRERLHKLLFVLSQNIPLVGYILKPFADYLPHWQDTHFYLWSS